MKQLKELSNIFFWARNPVWPRLEDIEKDYQAISLDVKNEGIKLAKVSHVDILTEPNEIINIVPLPENEKHYNSSLDGEAYWVLADFVLSEYPPKLGHLVSLGFENMAPRLGFSPYEEILMGMQYVDKKAGLCNISRNNLAIRHPEFYMYIKEKYYPERTCRALDFLTAAVLTCNTAYDARQKFQDLFVVPEMKEGVMAKIRTLDNVLARYITG